MAKMSESSLELRSMKKTHLETRTEPRQLGSIAASLDVLRKWIDKAIQVAMTLWYS